MKSLEITLFALLGVLNLPFMFFFSIVNEVGTHICFVQFDFAMTNIF